MSISQIFRLLFIAAIWGGSHVLVRITAPEIGPTLTAFSRILIAAIVLSLFVVMKRLRFDWKNHWFHFVAVGILNTAFPLFLFAYASLVLPASYLVILNATMPVFNAIFSSLFLGDSVTFKKVSGIILGLSGVVLLSEYGSADRAGEGFLVAMIAGLAASASYGACSVYIKKRAYAVTPMALTAGSNWIGFLILLPFAFWSFNYHGAFEWAHYSWHIVLMAITILGVFGSGIAFAIYYGLITEMGAFRSSIVAFLMPVFGLLWGRLFLNEEMTAGMLGGVALILIATSLFLKRSTNSPTART
jgi:drug/metabolite transporter (DMT)-like permease